MGTSRHNRRSESSDIHVNKKRSLEEENRMIAKYLANKAEKKALKLEKTETFIWRKKIERDVCQGRVPLDASYFKVKDEEERMAEIEKVKRRREERARQKSQREEEMELLARERVRAEFQDWERKEEEFNYEQCRIKSEKRLREGRVKPIDHLVFMSKHLNDGFESQADEFDHIMIDKEEPYMHAFKGLAVEGLEELREDIKMHLEHTESSDPLHQFWNEFLVVCESELIEARRIEAVDRARVRGEEPQAGPKGLHPSVELDVKAVLSKFKTYVQLEQFQCETKKRLSGEANIVEFWEAIHSRLPVLKAKAYLKEQYTKVLHKHLQRLQVQKVEDGEDKSNIVHNVVEAEPMEEEERTEEELGSFSPETFHGGENEKAIDAEKDRAILERQRMAVLENQQKRIQTAMPRPQKEDLKLKQAAMKAMHEGDMAFGFDSEVNLNPWELAWNDKYRPRKPKYYNRYHTGYEWNKYNQTHYDHDNPPPKVVQGYKFNIFYPDLIDRTITPKYTIERDEHPDNRNNDTCIIRFHGGPPYDDIAFRIVNRDWEYNEKKGFRSTFERGLLQLYFNLKRFRYRR